MKPENFLVRLHLEAVERFQSVAAWEHLDEGARETLNREVAGLPSDIPTDDIESRLFDLTALRMQLALAESDAAAFEAHRKRVVEIASLLEDKTAIPAVAEQLAYLAAVQESDFWEGIGLVQLEEMRLRLRGLIPFIDRKKRKVVYTDFEDEVLQVRPETVLEIPKMTGAQYQKKVEAYLKSHLDDLVIHKLRANVALTVQDLEQLEQTLVGIGEDDGEILLSGLLARSEAPSLVHFVRSLVGMDRGAAQAAFSGFLADRSLTPPQIRFIELVIDQLTARGVMEASALYESPFSGLNAGGPEAVFAGKENVIEGIFEALAVLQPRVDSQGGVSP